MNRAKTCLVLGAGASVPYRLPSGAALKDLILGNRSPAGAATALNFPLKYPQNGGTWDIQQDARIPDGQKALAAMNNWSGFLRRVCTDNDFSGEQLGRFRNEFFRAKSSSIDRFIQFNEEEFGEIGRLHIAATLLVCEHDHFLYGDWYAQLLDTIAPNGPQDIQDGALSVVTFNYDRSFEKFFLDAFEAGFRLPPQEAADLLAKIRIHHVYGDLGTLDSVPYGMVPEAHRIMEEVGSRINLVRPCADEDRKEKIRSLIADAENVCFIGFAFAPENLGLFDLTLLEKKEVFATVLGLSPTRISDLKSKLPGIHMIDGTAINLLHNHNIFTPKPVAPKSTGFAYESVRMRPSSRSQLF